MEPLPKIRLYRSPNGVISMEPAPDRVAIDDLSGTNYRSAYVYVFATPGEGRAFHDALVPHILDGISVRLAPVGQWTAVLVLESATYERRVARQARRGIAIVDRRTHFAKALRERLTTASAHERLALLQTLTDLIAEAQR